MKTHTEIQYTCGLPRDLLTISLLIHTYLPVYYYFQNERVLETDYDTTITNLQSDIVSTYSNLGT